MASSSDLEGQTVVEVDVSYAGGQELSEAAMSAALRPDMLAMSRGMLPEAAAFDGADSLQRLYRDNGWPDVAVRSVLSERQVRKGRIDKIPIKFHITPGRRFTVKRLKLLGMVSEQDGSELRALWRRELSGTFGLGDAYYVLGNLEALARDIGTWYRTRGYLEVEVEAPRPTRHPNNREVDVEIQIDPGPIFRFGKINVDHRVRRSIPESKFPRLPEGEIFTQVAAQKLVQELRAILRRAGHPNARVVPGNATRRTTESGARVDVEIEGVAGRRARIRSIQVSKTEETDPAFIKSRLELKEGDIYNGEDEDKSLAKLFATGLFTKVAIRRTSEGDAEPIGDGDPAVPQARVDIDEVQPDDGIIQPMDLMVEVKETETQSVEALGGYGSYERVRGGVRFEDRNVFGSAKEFAVEGRLSQKGFRGLVSVAEPYLFGTENRLSVTGDFYRREEPAFTDSSLGITVALSRDLSDSWTVRTGYSFRDHDGENIDLAGTIVQEEDFREGRVFAELRFQDLDSLLVPRQGTKHFLSVDTNHPSLGADVNFVRGRIGSAAYLPVGRGFGFSFRGDVGVIFPQEGSARVPIQERWFNGGESTVRSFREDRLGPADGDGSPRGGEYRNLFNVEFRMPIYGTLEGALFGDAGNVGIMKDDYGFEDMRYAVGGGLRLLLPIGPLRLDAGWNPDRRVGESEWTVHFSLGYPF